MARVVIIEFPGSSAEEVALAYSRVLKVEAQVVWHDTESLPGASLLVIPGGFSFCDYLRPGALAKASPIAPAIRRFSRSGRVLGIGNGFQILTELAILPGAFLPNAEAKFLAAEVSLTSRKSCSQLFPLADKLFRLPLACESGRYQIDSRSFADLERSEQIAFQYANEDGATATEPPTGSIGSIAGVSNQQGNVLGVMFHPERCVETDFGGEQGREILLAALGS